MPTHARMFAFMDHHRVKTLTVLSTVRSFSGTGAIPRTSTRPSAAALPRRRRRRAQRPLPLALPEQKSELDAGPETPRSGSAALAVGGGFSEFSGLSSSGAEGDMVSVASGDIFARYVCLYVCEGGSREKEK